MFDNSSRKNSRGPAGRNTLESLFGRCRASQKRRSFEQDEVSVVSYVGFILSKKNGVLWPLSHPQQVKLVVTFGGDDA